jgi:hypothetical protein
LLCAGIDAVEHRVGQQQPVHHDEQQQPCGLSMEREWSAPVEDAHMLIVPERSSGPPDPENGIGPKEHSRVSYALMTSCGEEADVHGRNGSRRW